MPSQVPDEIESVYQDALKAAEAGHKDLARRWLKAYKKLLDNWLAEQSQPSEQVIERAGCAQKGLNDA